MMPSIWSKLSLSSSPMKDSSNFLTSLEFQSCLGLGGFGIVLQAIDPTTSTNPTLTAVKFIFPSEEFDPKEEKQILRECQLASTFNHRNVVKILNVAGKQFKTSEIEKIFKNVSPDDKRSLSFRALCLDKAKRYKSVESICIQMELCGDTLRKWLHQQHDPNAVQGSQIRICRDIINGLKYLHDQKIIHRDLKPENIMFSANGFKLPAKIGDFGLCRSLHSNPESHTSSLTSRTGTLEYMAPEVYRNDYSFQVDYFSLGLVIWEVVQLIKFQERRTLFDALVSDKEENLVQLSGIFTPIKDTIINLTRKKPTERAQRLDEVVSIIQEIYQNSAIAFPTTSEELEMSLLNVKIGSRIVLGEGVFQGDFVLNVDGVKIEGQAPGKTVIKELLDKTGLIIVGSDCIISGLSIIPGHSMSGYCGINLQGSRNRILNVHVSGDELCIRVEGDENRLEELTISNAKDGILVQGSNNTIKHIKMEQIGHSAIWVDGSNNRLSHVHIVKGWAARNKVLGVWLASSGSFNAISNLTCSGYSRDKGDWALRMNSPDSSVQDSDCSPVRVGGRGAFLSNVNCGEGIYILDKATGVHLVNCDGQLLIFHTKVFTKDCHFHDIVKKGVSEINELK